MVEGPGLEPRLCDYQSQVLADYTIPPYKVLYKISSIAASLPERPPWPLLDCLPAPLFRQYHLPTQAPSASMQVFTFIQLTKVFALSISNFTRQFVYRVRRSVSAPFDFVELHCAYLCIYESMQTFALPTV